MNDSPEAHSNRDIRVSADRLRLRPPGLATVPVTGFAEGILRRYGAVQTAWQRAELDYRRAAAIPSTTVVQSFRRLTIAPNVTLNLASHAQQAVAPTGAPRVSQYSRLPLRIETLTRRLIKWGSRVESVRVPGSTGAGRRAGAGASSPGSEPAPTGSGTGVAMITPGGSSASLERARGAQPQMPARPVPRVVRRRPAEGNEQEQDPDRVEPIRRMRTGQSRTGAVGHGFAPGDMSSGEVNRLTDRVIQAIDRRIIAERERLGRI